MVFGTVIPRNVRLSEAPSFGVPVILHDPYSRRLRCLHLARPGGRGAWLAGPNGAPASAAGSRRSCRRRPPTPPPASCSSCRSTLIKPNPAQPRTTLRPRRPRRAGRLDRGQRGRPAAARPPPPRRQLRAGRRRAPLARRPAGRAGEGPGRGPRPGRAGAAAGGADREHGPRGPEPGRGGESLRRPGRGPRPDQRGAGAPGRPQPPRRLQPDPPARAARRGARRCSQSGELSEGHGRALLGATGNDVRRRLAREAVAGGWSVRETENRVRLAGQPKARPRKAPIDPDQRAALDDAGDALEAALGHEVDGARPRGTGIVVELRFDDLDEAPSTWRASCAGGASDRTPGDSSLSSPSPGD